MSDDEVPEPSAAASEIGPEDEEAGSDQCFSKSEMTSRNQKKSEKRALGKDRPGDTAKWDSLGQVGWST